VCQGLRREGVNLRRGGSRGLTTPTRRRHLRGLCVLLLTVVAISVLWTEPAQGIPEYAKILPQELKNFCNVCHVKNSGGPLNSFGEDFTRYGEDLAGLMERDSDSDGYANGDELAEAKFPGNPKSFPGEKKGISNIMIAIILGVVVSVALVALKFLKR